MHTATILAVLAFFGISQAAVYPFAVSITPNADQSVTVVVGNSWFALPASFVADYPTLQRLFITPISNSPGTTSTITVSITMNNDGSVTSSVQGAEGTVQGTMPAAIVSQLRAVLQSIIGMIDPLKTPPRVGKKFKESKESKHGKSRHHRH